MVPATAMRFNQARAGHRHVTAESFHFPPWTICAFPRRPSNIRGVAGSVLAAGDPAATGAEPALPSRGSPIAVQPLSALRRKRNRELTSCEGSGVLP